MSIIKKILSSIAVKIMLKLKTKSIRYRLIQELAHLLCSFFLLVGTQEEEFFQILFDGLWLFLYFITMVFRIIFCDLLGPWQVKIKTFRFIDEKLQPVFDYIGFTVMVLVNIILIFVFFSYMVDSEDSTKFRAFFRWIGITEFYLYLITLPMYKLLIAPKIAARKALDSEMSNQDKK